MCVRRAVDDDVESEKMEWMADRGTGPTGCRKGERESQR